MECGDALGGAVCDLDEGHEGDHEGTDPGTEQRVLWVEPITVPVDPEAPVNPRMRR